MDKEFIYGRYKATVPLESGAMALPACLPLGFAILRAGSVLS